jgi:membrane protein required for colicin V production
MTGFDIAVLLIVGFGAVTGFARGFVQESFALAAWVIAVAAIRTLHPGLSALLIGVVHTESGAWVLAYALLLLVPYVLTKLLAAKLGAASRASVLGPIDRMLGFGFGAVKGTVIVVLLFSVVALGYDVVWGRNGRPDWITQSRTYPFVNACSEQMLKVLAQRRREAQGTEAQDTEAPGDEATPAPAPTHHHHHHATEE